MPDSEPRETKPTQRIKGELQEQYPEITPLPPTPVTKKAKEQFERWKMSEEYIEELRFLTSVLRYDLCPQKAARIAKKGGYFYLKNSYEYIVIPDFFDYQKRLDGQCGDIAVQLLNLMHSPEINFFGRLNEHRKNQGRVPIRPCLLSGLSTTHFNREGFNHTWFGLYEEGNPNPAKGIYIDPSFQLISEGEESQYTIAPEHIFRNPKKLEGEKSAIIPIGTYHKALINSYAKTLGTSSDGKLVYSLGFTRDPKTEKIMPFISLLFPEADKNKLEMRTLCLLRDDNLIWQHPDPEVTENHKIELTKMLTSLNQMVISNNQSEAKEVAELRIAINY